MMDYDIHVVSVMHYLNLKLSSTITQVYIGDDYEVFKRSSKRRSKYCHIHHAYYVVGMLKEDIAVVTADEENQNDFERWVEQNYENLYDFVLMDQL